MRAAVAPRDGAGPWRLGPKTDAPEEFSFPVCGRSQKGVSCLFVIGAFFVGFFVGVFPCGIPAVTYSVGPVPLLSTVWSKVAARAGVVGAPFCRPELRSSPTLDALRARLRYRTSKLDHRIDSIPLYFGHGF